MQLNRYSEALQAAQRFHDLDPTSAAAYGLIGYAHMLLGQWPAAKAAYGRARALDPGRSIDALMAGMIDYGEGDYAAAERDFAEARRNMEAGEDNQAYAALFQALLALRRGEAPGPILEGVTADRRLGPLFAAVKGGSAEAAIAAAAALSPDEERDRYLTEAYVYLAELALIRGERRRAADWTAAALAIGRDMGELALARRRAAELGVPQ